MKSMAYRVSGLALYRRPGLTLPEKTHLRFCRVIANDLDFAQRSQSNMQDGLSLIDSMSYATERWLETMVFGEPNTFYPNSERPFC